MQAHLKQGCFGTTSLWCLYWHACLWWHTFVTYSDATAVWLQSMAFLLYWKTDLLKRLCNYRDCFMKFFFFLMSRREVELPVVKLLASIIIWLVRFLVSHKNFQSIWLNEWRHDCKPFKFRLQFSLLIWAVSKLSKVSIRQRPAWLAQLTELKLIKCQPKFMETCCFRASVAPEEGAELALKCSALVNFGWRLELSFCNCIVLQFMVASLLLVSNEEMTNLLWRKAFQVKPPCIVQFV